MVLVMLGITIMINAKYNPFQDSTVSLVALFWFFFVISAIWIIKKAAYKFNIDGWRDFDNNSKNSNAISDYSKK
jgi:hypothetical protein